MTTANVAPDGSEHSWADAPEPLDFDRLLRVARQTGHVVWRLNADGDLVPLTADPTTLAAPAYRPVRVGRRRAIATA